MIIYNILVRAEKSFIRSAALFLVICLFISCNQSDNQSTERRDEIDSLRKQLAETYKPGFGEFMSGIQMHHAKLWFAGQNQNWPLADFEVHEIRESLDDIENFCKDRPETKSIGMINAPMDSIITAIQQKNPALFKNSFVLLTNTCNKCHQATDHGFNVVIVPSSLPVTNQDFKPTR